MREAVTFDEHRNVANFERKTPKRWTSQMAVGRFIVLYAGFRLISSRIVFLSQQWRIYLQNVEISNVGRILPRAFAGKRIAQLNQQFITYLHPLPLINLIITKSAYIILLFLFDRRRSCKDVSLYPIHLLSWQ